MIQKLVDDIIVCPVAQDSPASASGIHRKRDFQSLEMCTSQWSSRALWATFEVTLVSWGSFTDELETMLSRLRVLKEPLKRYASTWHVMVVRNTYRDSIGLMQVAGALNRRASVSGSTCTLATDHSVSLLVERGIPKELLLDVSSSDLIVAVQAETDEAGKSALAAAKGMLSEESDESGASGEDGAPKIVIRSLLESSRSWTNEESKTGWALISVPGDFAAAEAQKALRLGLNAFIFSDNVSITDELNLKQEAAKRNLLVSGPDCGTGIINGIPFGFANSIRSGNVGLVGASGTGLQEVGCLLDSLGVGCSQVFGTGGRDLSDKIGGQTTLAALKILANDPDTKQIVIVAKSTPQDGVLKTLLTAAEQTKKPTVVCFIGKPSQKSSEIIKQYENHPQVRVVSRLEDASISTTNSGQNPARSVRRLDQSANGVKGKLIGLFSGGTFAHEAEMILESFPGLEWGVTDYGDDEFTVGRPHPMIDYTVRCEALLERGGDPDVSAIILDVVLGAGSHPDPAAPLVDSLQNLRRIRKSDKNSKQLLIAVHVVGTETDPQGLKSTSKRIKEAYPEAVELLPSSAQAIFVAADFAAGKNDITYLDLGKKARKTRSGASGPQHSSIRIANVGLSGFVGAAERAGAKVDNLEWRPPAGGNRELGLLTSRLVGDERVAEANQKALEKLRSARAQLIAVGTASELIANKPKSNRWLLHAGPPVRGGWSGMCGPMRGAVIGAVLLEGWANTHEEAEKLAASGEIEFSPCHHHGAVGPMAGLVSPSMGMFHVRNDAASITAFSTINEGLGKALRFGANDSNVLSRLRFMRDELASTLNDALKASGGVDVKVLLSQALLMGDEGHNRNAAATSLFTRHMALHLARLGERGQRALEFLSANDHFFLNISMAASKSAMDSIEDIPNSTVVTTMARNGVDFGVRIAGAPGKWFVAQSPTVDGLYFSGYGPGDANPDLGDSSITETFGIGGFAMAAAPAIVRFIGGNVATSKNLTLEMDRICIGRHEASIAIPSLDFRAPALAIDALAVSELAVAPVINTGIAHKNAGVGQIGAGICRAPIAAFVEAAAEVSRRLK
jgi:succinyl-CoA synthetase alpha subunit